jgi:uncharacterized protein YndB with AHSA1/START domain
MRWLGFGAGGIALVVVVVVVIGALLPVAHVATRSLVLPRSPSEVWSTMTDFAGLPSWRPGLKGVEVLPPRDGRVVFREDASYGRVTYEVVEQEAPRRLVTRIADDSLPFGGRWIYVLEPEGDTTRVTITEEGSVKNPLFRFMSRFVFGHYASIDAYLAALRAKLG